LKEVHTNHGRGKRRLLNENDVAHITIGTVNLGVSGFVCNAAGGIYNPNGGLLFARELGSYMEPDTEDGQINGIHPGFTVLKLTTSVNM